MDLGLHRRLTAAEGSSLPFNQSNLKNQTEKKKKQQQQDLTLTEYKIYLGVFVFLKIG